jgi:hypothetical protein
MSLKVTTSQTSVDQHRIASLLQHAEETGHEIRRFAFSCSMLLRGFVMSRFCQRFLCLLVALPAAVQSQAFTAVTLKVVRSASPRDERVQVRPNGDLVASSVPLITLLSYAYDVPVNPSPLLSGLPDWAISDRLRYRGDCGD